MQEAIVLFCVFITAGLPLKADGDVKVGELFVNLYNI